MICLYLMTGGYSFLNPFDMQQIRSKGRQWPPWRVGILKETTKVNAIIEMNRSQKLCYLKSAKKKKKYQRLITYSPYEKVQKKIVITH